MVRQRFPGVLMLNDHEVSLAAGDSVERISPTTDLLMHSFHRCTQRGLQIERPPAGCGEHCHGNDIITTRRGGCSVGVSLLGFGGGHVSNLSRRKRPAISSAVFASGRKLKSG